MSIRTIFIVATIWILFFAGIMIWYWPELSNTDRYFIIGGEAVLIGVDLFLGIKMYQERERF